MAYLPARTEAGSSHRRRTSWGLNAPVESRLRNTSPTKTSFGTTPFDEEEEERKGHMSLDRSPSPKPDGGWSSPGLAVVDDQMNGGASRSRGPSPAKRYGDLNGGHSSVSWASAKERSARVNGYPSYQSQNTGFFSRHMRRLSESLPYFAHGGQEDRIAEKERLHRVRGGGQARVSWKEMPRRIGLLISRRRKYVALMVILLVALLVWFHKRKSAILFAITST